ncbi:hypothetical protein F4703DRAFT_1489581 [Phycomyces blakesleeanus]
MYVCTYVCMYVVMCVCLYASSFLVPLLPSLFGCLVVPFFYSYFGSLAFLFFGLLENFEVFVNLASVNANGNANGKWLFDVYKQVTQLIRTGQRQKGRGRTQPLAAKKEVPENRSALTENPPRILPRWCHFLYLVQLVVCRLRMYAGVARGRTERLCWWVNSLYSRVSTPPHKPFRNKEQSKGCV